MSATDINLPTSYFNWPEVAKLSGLLGRGTETLPLRLWARCGEIHYEDGKLSGYTAAEVEGLVHWWGEPGRMVAAMVKVGFLRPLQGQEGFLVMYRGEESWLDWNGHIRAYKAKGQALAAARHKKALEEAARALGAAGEAPPPSPSGSVKSIANATVYATGNSIYSSEKRAPQNDQSQRSDRTATEGGDRTPPAQQPRQGVQPQPKCSPARESHVVVRGFAPMVSPPPAAPGRWSSMGELLATYRPNVNTPRQNHELELLQRVMPFGHRKGLRVQDLSEEDARFYAPMARGKGLRRALELRVEQWAQERRK